MLWNGWNISPTSVVPPSAPALREQLKGFREDLSGRIDTGNERLGTLVSIAKAYYGGLESRVERLETRVGLIEGTS